MEQPQDGYYTEDTATFGDRVAAARDVLSLTQAQLANRLGIREKTLADWENDRSEPRANRLQMLAGVLNVSMIWLMTGEGEGVEPIEEDPAADRRDLILELRAIREEAMRLTSRMARLEKQLRARPD